MEVPLYELEPEAAHWNLTNHINNIKMDSNFAWLLCSLVSAMAWVIYITYYNARVMGFFITRLLNKLFIHTGYMQVAGHFRSNCPKLKGKKQQKNSTHKANVAEASDDEFSLTVSTSVACCDGSVWLLDSGATEHMISDKNISLVSNKRRLSKSIKIKIAKSESMLCAEEIGDIHTFVTHKGSITCNVLSGKIMFRNIAYVTHDYTIRIQDGWLIFRWWRSYVPKDVSEDPFSFEAVDKLDNSLQTEFLDLKYDYEAKIIFKQSGYELFWVKLMDTYPQLWGKTEPLLISFPSTYLVEKGFSSVVQLLTKQKINLSHSDTRLSVQLNGFELHVYNRCKLYSKLEQDFFLGSQMFPCMDETNKDGKEKSENKITDDALGVVTISGTQGAASLSHSWRDLIPVIKMDISSGRVVFGNRLVPTTLSINVEEAHFVYSTKPAASRLDHFMHFIKCKSENFKVRGIKY
uniref:Bridge-like lipid transfer protein family member 1 N-terminal domain-containing protein n=1 Tax=Timema tahoe TaxID=61484 RepID=A0A7R9IRK5_9NEOP|nr:unnamed protein product [Timema tahoe]